MVGLMVGSSGPERLVKLRGRMNNHRVSSVAIHTSSVQNSVRPMQTSPTLSAVAKAFLLCFALTIGSPAGHAAEKLNVLYIVSDDLNTRLACYGDNLAQTPNLDRLATQGVRFDRAYCQYPLCSPSRTSFMTGLRPDHNGVVSNSKTFREKLPDHITLPQSFKQAGWFTARIGKIFHYAVPAQIGTDGVDDAPSWEKVINPKGRDVTDEEEIFSLRPDLEGASRFAGTLSWLAAKGTDAEQTDGMTALATVKLLEENQSRPFFIAAGFFRPHTPYVAPKKYFDLYPLDKIKLPDALPNVKDLFPAAALTIRKDQEAMTDTQRRQAIQAYLACISFMDAQVGHVLDALDRLKLHDKTIIVFQSDHGYHLGEKHLWQKMSLFEQCARVPLIIDAPGMAQGKTCSRIVELVSLYPTLTDLCGIKPTVKLDGLSMRPLLQNPSAPWAHPALTQQQRGAPQGTFDNGKKPANNGFMGYSLRTDRWRYTEWDEGKKGLELYDHFNDPQEMKNLADDPSLQKTRDGLKAQLRQLLAHP